MHDSMWHGIALGILDFVCWHSQSAQPPRYLTEELPYQALLVKILWIDFIGLVLVI